MLTDEMMKEDFRLFLWSVFKFHLSDILTDPTPLQYDIALFLSKDKHTRKVVEAFRGIGKSYITAIYCVWRLWKNPRVSVLVLSASKDKSDQIATFMFRLFKDVPCLKALDPELDKRRGARTSKLSFDVIGAGNKQSPSCRASGILGQITGSRADIILADDIEIPNNSDTPTKRSKLKIAIEEFESILTTGDGKEIIFLGTPQSQESIYNSLSDAFKLRMWPSQYPSSDEDLRYYRNSLSPMLAHKLKEDPGLAGMPTDTRFNQGELDQRIAGYGKSGYALQFLLNTQLSDELKYPLRCRDLIFMDLDSEVHPEKPVWATGKETEIPVTCEGFEGDGYFQPMQLVGEWVHYQGGVMTVDPSGRGHDETAYCVVKWGNGYVYVLDIGGVPGGFEESSLIGLAKIAKKWGVSRMLPERNYGGGMFGELMRPILSKYAPGCGLPTDPKEMPFHTTQKEVRIITCAEPLMNSHRVVVNKCILELDRAPIEGVATAQQKDYHFFHQLSRVSRERGCLKHDDRLDAYAMALTDAQEAMGLDPDLGMEENARQKWDERMDRYLTNDRFGGHHRWDTAWTSDEGAYPSDETAWV